MRIPAYKEGPLYAHKISPFIGKQIIKVLTGQRSVGKSYILFQLRLKIFEIGEKYYFEDLGLRNALWGQSQRMDLHQMLENAVYLHLKQLGFNVFVGQQGSQKIDFVAEKQGNKVYVQVCLQMSTEKNINREFGNLLQVKDNYPKYVVSLNDPIIGDNYKGIIHINIQDFLMLDL